MKPTASITKMLLGMILIASNSYANNSLEKDSTKECLEVVGVAIGTNNEAIDGAEIRLYKENEEMEWTEITSVTYHDHNFKFTLEANSYYTIEVSKPGYVNRSIAISTKLPSNVNIEPMFRYEFDVVLFKENKKIDDYYMDFPVALISYNATTETFENNKAYTKHIKTKIKESEEQAKVENKNSKKVIATN